jgi:predicted RNA-binding Zn-ribbon protein involved in translation (DUF1610 family)
MDDDAVGLDGGAGAPSNEEAVCFSCGYSLVGLPREGLCPECGEPVARSYEGDRLVHSAPEYLRKLHLGVTLILVSVIGSIIVGFGTGVLGATGYGQAQLLSAILSAGVSIVSAVGWWLFSEPDIRLQHYGGQNARLFVRVAVLVNAAIALVSFVGTFVSDEFAGATQQIGAGGSGAWVLFALGVVLLQLVASAVHFFASMLYLRWLAPRFPDHKLYKDARRFMWVGPLLYTVGALACGLGPLVALIMYCVMFLTVRRHLDAAMKEQAAAEW